MKKPSKPVLLKQYLVSGAPSGSHRVKKAAFILHTCPKLAKEEFTKKFPDCVVWEVRVTAESEMTKDDLAGHDFWEEHNNWMLIDD